MRGPTRVVFMPVKDGDVIDISGMRGHTSVHHIGFKPGPARSRSGWLVLLVHEGTSQQADSYGRPQPIEVPKSAAPRKLRG